VLSGVEPPTEDLDPALVRDRYAFQALNAMEFPGLKEIAPPVAPTRRQGTDFGGIKLPECNRTRVLASTPAGTLGKPMVGGPALEGGQLDWRADMCNAMGAEGPASLGQPTIPGRTLPGQPTLPGMTSPGALSSPSLGARLVEPGLPGVAGLDARGGTASLFAPSPLAQTQGNGVAALDVRALNYRSAVLKSAAARGPATLAKDRGKLIEQLEGPRTVWTLSQMVEGVPIENVALTVAGRPGQQKVDVFGAAIARHRIANQKLLSVQQVTQSLVGRLRDAGFAISAAQAEGIGRTAAPLVLLPVDQLPESPGGPLVTVLRNAYRTPASLVAQSRGQRTISWTFWIDAEDGSVLRMVRHTQNGRNGRGRAWALDASGQAGETMEFDIDEPDASGAYRLQLAGVFQRVDTEGDGRYLDEVETRDGNFDVKPLNDEQGALCKSGTNKGFRQVHAFAHLWNFYRMVSSAGSIASFPEKPLQISIDEAKESDVNQADYASGTLSFSEGAGFASPKCPLAPQAKLNGAQDATILAHEMAHLSTQRLTDQRPGVQCSGGNCPVTVARQLFHDFADAYAALYAGTPCIGGWVGKNLNNAAGAGVRDALHCTIPGTTSEQDQLPRLAMADDEHPIYKGHVLDRFPDHRGLAGGKGPYADGQIAAAAMWLLREGMWDASGEAGLVALWSRFNGALADWGYAAMATDQDWSIYERLRELLVHLVRAFDDQEDEHNVNKVLSAFARAGIFLTSWSCLQPTATARSCPDGMGPTAIVDVELPVAKPPVAVLDDANTLTIANLRPLLAPSAQGPRFRVWTGVPFRGVGANARQDGTRCNDEFMVKILDATGNKVLEESSWQPVTKPCYGTWQPSRWATYRSGNGSFFQYQVGTRRRGTTSVIWSTEPTPALKIPPARLLVEDQPATGRAQTDLQISTTAM
jgi:hypothetical protein